jgi:hypothetical protein
MALATTDAGTFVMRVNRLQSGIIQDPARFRVAVCGRRFGKTTLEKAEATKEFGTPGRVWYVAPTYDMARDLMWEPLKAIVPASWVASTNETRMELTTLWGCQFACKSADNPDRLRGRGIRRLLCDEFQDWKDAKTTWEEVLLPTLLDSDGGALIVGTPKPGSYLYDLFQKGTLGHAGWKAWQYRTIDAPHISGSPSRLALLEQLREQMDPRSFRQEFEASFEALAGRVYYAFHRQKHVAPVTLDPSLPVAVTFDFNIDPATAIIGQAHGPNVRVWREVRITHAGGEATRATAARAAALLQEAGYRGEVRVYGDATGKAGKTTGPSDHAVLREVFPRCTWRIPAGQPHVRDRIAAVNSRCETATGESHLMVDPSCTGLIADLEQVTFAENGEIDKRSNPALTHLSDAFGYWIVRDFPVVTRGPVAAAAWVEALL